jgi:HPt (histidine-containing phosphotransfer) domain-containing protein
MNESVVLDERALAKLSDKFDEGFKQEMLRLFFEYVPVKLAEAKGAGQRGDLAGVKAGTHPIKSSANKVGAVAVWKLAGRIEELADQGNPDAVRLLPDLEQAYSQVSVLLRQHVKG